MVDPGLSFFRVTTPEEWEWMLARNHGPYETQISAMIQFFQTMLLYTLVLCLANYYRKKRPLRVADVVIPTVGLAVYYPCFHYIKYEAEHYYLWMRCIPTEMLSLVMLFLLVAARKHGKSNV